MLDKILRLSLSIICTLFFAISTSQVVLTAPLNAAPSNDDFTDRTTLKGKSGSISGTNVGATIQKWERNYWHAMKGGASIWYSWQAPYDGTATFNTFGSNFDTMLAIYTWKGTGPLNTKSTNNDVIFFNSKSKSRVDFITEKGALYYIAVSGYGGDTGALKLNWLLVRSNYPVQSGYGAIRGKVTHTHAPAGPISGAQVRIYDIPDMAYEYSDSRGFYEFQEVPNGMHWVMVYSKGYGSSGLLPVLVENNLQSVDVQFARGPTGKVYHDVRGIVVDITGIPVSRATVWDPQSGGRTTSDADGAFSLTSSNLVIAAKGNQWGVIMLEGQQYYSQDFVEYYQVEIVLDRAGAIP